MRQKRWQSQSEVPAAATANQLKSRISTVCDIPNALGHYVTFCRRQDIALPRSLVGQLGVIRFLPFLSAVLDVA